MGHGGRVAIDRARCEARRGDRRLALPGSATRLDNLGGANHRRCRDRQRGTVVVKVDEGADLFRVSAEARRRVVELGDVEPFGCIDPLNLQPIHRGAGRQIDDGDVVESPNGDSVPGAAEPRDDDVAAPGGICAIRSNDGSKSGFAGELDASDVDRCGRCTVKKVGALLITCIVEGENTDICTSIRLGRRNLVDSEAGLLNRFDMAAVLDL